MTLLNSLRGDVWKTITFRHSSITIYRQGSWFGGGLAAGLMLFLYLPQYWEGVETPWLHLLLVAGGTYIAHLLSFSIRHHVGTH
ncbi:hypothetical protein [Variovorax saccharolyticus]|uniref:hypothetical protein n=1 Tax=Variovorax saccharolyticus TaxID=3053516 RepID=UPI002577DEA2|nr:hypothetical protein [Variovorax sp. J31P216]MDM0028333.1 hypothetical protein [Variovorax sp. J31P216]